MGTYTLFFNNDQLADFNTTAVTATSQTLTINGRHPAWRLEEAGAINSYTEIDQWRFTVQGDDGLDTNGNDVVPGAPMVIEYTTDGGETWNNYVTDIGVDESEYFYRARQDEEGWMAIVMDIPDESDPDRSYGFIVSDIPPQLGDEFITDERYVTDIPQFGDLIDDQVGEYILPCFVAGTIIETQNGSRNIETLSVGDMIRTVDHGLQPIRWIGKRELSGADLEANPHLKPIRIAKDAIGAGLPTQTLSVSPQHRMLVRSRIASNRLKQYEVLVAAKHLTTISGIEVAAEANAVTYYHIMFDQHEIVFANGAETESFYTGATVINGVDLETRSEILELFPELATGSDNVMPARPLIDGRKARELAMHHVFKGASLVEQPSRSA